MRRKFGDILKDERNLKFSEREISELCKSDLFVLDARELFEKKKNTKTMEFEYGGHSYYTSQSSMKKELHETNSKPPSKFYGDIEEIRDWVEINFQEFKNFAIHDRPPGNHRFLNKPYSFGVALTRRIERERETLRQYLPNSIFVRVYHSRIDVMRAVIVVDLEGTPYYQGLFFFDIFIPRNPAQPPELFYRSYGFDLNPILQNDGKVSLGDNLRQSTILEILVSIQQLILMNGTKPYIDCNYSRRKQENSSKLNQMVLIQTSEAMLRMLEWPPQGFEAYVLGYFRTKAHHILLNYKACAVLEDQAMKLLFFKLVKAFETNGTYCRHHYDQKQYDLALTKEELSDDERNTSLFVSVKRTFQTILQERLM